MGMYTEMQSRTRINKPDELKIFIADMSHSFFTLPRASHITLNLFKCHYDGWVLEASADMKNYDDEIGEFFRWIVYFTSDFVLGWSIYEESSALTYHYTTKRSVIFMKMDVLLKDK